MKRLLTVVLVGLLFVGTTAGVGQRTEHRHADLFWRVAHIRGVNAEHHGSWEAMAQAADAVVVVRLRSVELGRVFGEPNPTLPHPEDVQVFEAAVSLEVEEVLLGSLDPPEAWTLEVHIPEPAHVEKLAASLTEDRTVLFLRSKAREARDAGASEEAIAFNTGFYRLVTDQAAVIEIDGVARPAEGEPEKAFESIAGESFEAVLADLRAMSGPVGT